MDILQVVKEAWGWTGIDPLELVAENKFGNLILKDEANQFWRLCPEDVYCEIVADSIAAYNELIKDEEFVTDWFMDAIVEDAEQSRGELPEGQRYCLVLSGILGGDYGGANIKIAPLEEIIRQSGALGLKVKDLPDGAMVSL